MFTNDNMCEIPHVSDLHIKAANVRGTYLKVTCVNVHQYNLPKAEGLPWVLQCCTINQNDRRRKSSVYHFCPILQVWDELSLNVWIYLG